ncbi:MAG: cobalamin-dependent protein [Candidatus Helarchaeota archaeon]
MKSNDILFIHPPRTFQIDYNKKYASRSSNAFLPMGLPAIVNYCQTEGGFDVKLLNVPLELHLNKKFSFSRSLKSLDFDVCAIDLHWLLHSYGTIKIAELIKKQRPDAKIIIGGYTATYYAREILENFPDIDAVIRGEGEVPFLKYVSSLKNGKDFTDVPNLTYRKGDKIRETPISYVANDIDHLNFIDLSFMDHWREYFKLCEKSVMPFSIMIARGCPFNCPFCGGGRRGQYIINKRRKILLRSPEKVVSDIKALEGISEINTIFFGHGYYRKNEDYFLEIFRQLRKEKIELGGALEIWRLPFKNLLKEFAKTFIQGLSLLEYNIQAFSDNVLKRYRSVLDPTLRNDPEELRKLMDSAKYYNIPLRLWVNIGNPHETLYDILQGIKFVLKLNAENLLTKNYVCIYNTPITASPGSPIFESPEKFGITLFYKTFRDFYSQYEKMSNKFGELDLMINYENKTLGRKMKFLINTLYHVLEYPMFIKNVSNTVVNGIIRQKRMKKKNLNKENDN